jgi:hypothetical protein
VHIADDDRHHGQSPGGLVRLSDHPAPPLTGALAWRDLSFDRSGGKNLHCVAEINLRSIDPVEGVARVTERPVRDNAPIRFVRTPGRGGLRGSGTTSGFFMTYKLYR